MSYSIEFAQDPCSAFYAEFVIVNRNTGGIISGEGIDHRLNVVGWGQDYGCWGRWGTTLASNANGRITVPVLGALAVAIPPSVFAFYGCRQTLRFNLLAVPANPDFSQVLAGGTISFGGHMTNPRIRLEAYPLYPNSLTGGGVGTPTVSQYLRALSVIIDNGVSLLEAAVPASPDDPSRVILSNSASVPAGGTFESLVASALSLSSGQLEAIRVYATTLPI